MIKNDVNDWICINAVDASWLGGRFLSSSSLEISGYFVGDAHYRENLDALPETALKAFSLVLALISKYLRNQHLSNYSLRVLKAIDILEEGKDRYVVNVDPDTCNDDFEGFTKYESKSNELEIHCHYKRDISSFTNLVHEAFHAIQIVSSRSNTDAGKDGELMPPLCREVCAFLGELLFLKAVQESFPSVHPAMSAYNKAQNNIYLDDDLKSLKRSLESEETAEYSYRWNYPVARLLAIHIFQASNDSTVLLAEICELFCSGANSPALLKKMAQKASRARLINNVSRLPSIMTFIGEKPLPAEQAMDVYRKLGAIAMLQLCERDHTGDTIGNTYSDISPHFKDNSFIINIDQSERPNGYAIWSNDSSKTECAILRSSAPFGHQLSLLRSIKRAVTSSQAVTRHPLSAQAEQRAW